MFQSTLPVRGATWRTSLIICLVIYVSIHAPREGSDSSLYFKRHFAFLFQSTLPVRGATWKNGRSRL